MNDLSVQEREAAYEEVHGIANANPETTERITKWLSEFDEYLSTIKTGSTYELAESMDRSYVTSAKFRMMFLRADRYDVRKAARRMLKFMDIKENLFGAAKLTQKITLADLDEDDIACLRRGCPQIPSVRDIAGRPIVVGIPSLRQYKSIESELRARHYVVMSLTESEETQISGAIGIWYSVTPTNIHPSTYSAKRKFGSNSGLLWNLPIYWAAGHFCCNNFWFYILSAPVILLSNSAHRIRVHYGNHQKCLEQLGTFGIPREGIPLNDQMEASFDEHERWLESRKEEESLALGAGARRALHSSSLEVRPEDILFGRGKGSQNHPGNIHLRSIIASHQDTYDRALTPLAKTAIARGIAEEIQRRGGRFLKVDEDQWKEASTKESRAKIMMTFRSQRKIIKQGQNLQ